MLETAESGAIGAAARLTALPAAALELAALELAGVELAAFALAPSALAGVAEVAPAEVAVEPALAVAGEPAADRAADRAAGTYTSSSASRDLANCGATPITTRYWLIPL